MKNTWLGYRGERCVHAMGLIGGQGFSGGNRTMTGYTTGVGNELLASPGATYAYDAEGNLAAKTETFTGNVWSYTYLYRWYA